jgi:hypothetical protein
MCPSCTLSEATRKAHKGKSATISLKTNRTPLKKLKPKNASYWMKQADLWFSRLVRVTKCQVFDGEPYCACIVTGKIFHAKNLDCGHMISRGNMETRYDLRNCWPQNRSSNPFRGEADKPKFQQAVSYRIGIPDYDALIMTSNSVKFGAIELEKMASDFRNQVNQICKEKGINKWW